MKQFFKTQADFEHWLEKHHDSANELILHYCKKSTGKESIDWSQSVDAALMYGWIDGIRRKVNEEVFTVRFTPRRPNSIWSNRNIDIANALIALGIMKPAGRKAFDRRKEDNSGVYGFQRDDVELLPWQLIQFKSNGGSWEYYENLPKYYKKMVTHWVSSAKRKDTQERRLLKLIESCEKNVRLKQFTSTK